jgi:hypothetical protein
VSYFERFAAYFSREVAERAAASLANGAQIQFRVVSPEDGATPESFVFGRAAGKNTLATGEARDPQISFTLTPAAAEEILADTREDVGALGVSIAKLILSADANRRVGFKVHCGFFALFTQGYFGVVKTGGGAFASYLASKGLSGVAGIKAALKKLKG